MPSLERDFQANLIKRLEVIFPQAYVMKLDTGYMPGIPDLLILFGATWAMLECKKGPRSKRQPNQPWYVDEFNSMSFAAFISPDNEEDVLHALQQTFGTGG